MIAISCGIKISVVDCLVLSKSTRATDGQNYDSQDRASIAVWCGNKIVSFITKFSIFFKFTKQKQLDLTELDRITTSGHNYKSALLTLIR